MKGGNKEKEMDLGSETLKSDLILFAFWDCPSWISLNKVSARESPINSSLNSF